MGFLEPIKILKSKKIPISNILADIFSQRYAVESGYLTFWTNFTNLIPDISTLNRKHFTYQSSKNGHLRDKLGNYSFFKSLFTHFSGLNKQCVLENIQYMQMLLNLPLSVNNIGEPMYQSGPDWKPFSTAVIWFVCCGLLLKCCGTTQIKANYDCWLSSRRLYIAKGCLLLHVERPKGITKGHQYLMTWKETVLSISAKGHPETRHTGPLKDQFFLTATAAFRFQLELFAELSSLLFLFLPFFSLFSCHSSKQNRNVKKSN